MYLLKTISKETAHGDQKEIFDWFEDKPINTPPSLQRYAISPNIAKFHLDLIRYFSSHKTLNFALLSSIRYAIASKVCYDSCIAINETILKRSGMTDEDLKAVASTQQDTPLEEHEEALLQFAVTRVLHPEQGCTQEQLQDLYQLGWTEQDLFDVTYHGYTLLSGSQLTASLSTAG